MTAQDLWQEGRLDEAIEAQLALVKSRPTDAEARYLLFALVVFSGDLERAARQLDAIGLQDEQLARGTFVYVNLLASEADRRRAMAGEADPLTPELDDASLAARRDAVRAFGTGDSAAARAAVETARENARDVRVRVDGQEFAGAEDTDELLGDTLEVFAGGRYLLVPFFHLRRLEISEPKHLLDLAWIPAELEDVTGAVANVHLPVLYAGSHEASRPLALGRSSEWAERDGIVRGLGQRVLAFGGDGDPENDRPLLTIRRLERIED